MHEDRTRGTKKERERENEKKKDRHRGREWERDIGSISNEDKKVGYIPWVPFTRGSITVDQNKMLKAFDVLINDLLSI